MIELLPLIILRPEIASKNDKKPPFVNKDIHTKIKGEGERGHLAQKSPFVNKNGEVHRPSTLQIQDLHLNSKTFIDKTLS